MKIMQYLNKEQKENYSLMCPKYNKKANVSIIFRLSKQCKTDIQITKTVSSIECDLWKLEGCFCPKCESKMLKELIKQEKKMAYCMECGKKIPENAKFCRSCGAKQDSNNLELENISESSKRKTTYDGVIHKCPNCGEELKSFQTICPSCKYELRDLNNSKSVKDFNKKLLQAKSKQDKIKVIKTADIPNSREDIFEFMTIATSNFDAASYVNHLNEEDETDAWLSLIEQCYQKGKLSLPESDLVSIKLEYDKIQAKIKEYKIKNVFNKIYPIAFIAIGLLLVLTQNIALGLVGLVLTVVGIVVLSSNRKKKDLHQPAKEQIIYGNKSKNRGYHSWSTTAKVLWVVLNIYTFGIPALIYWNKNK